MQLNGSRKAGAALAALAFFTAVAYFPGAINTATSLRWAALAVGCPLILILLGRMPSVLGGAGLAVVGMMGFSLAWSPDFLNGADYVVHLMILACVFCVGAAADDLMPAWRGLAAGVTVSAVIAIPQLFGLDIPGVHQHAVPAGLFENKNMLAEAALAASIPMLLAGSWLATGPIVALAVTGSKGAYAAAAVVAVVLLWPRQRMVAWLVALGVIVSIVFVMVHGSPSLDARMDIWLIALSELKWLGNGIAAFATNHPGFEFPHSEPLQAIYEYGLLALVPGLVLVHLLGAKDHEAEHLVLVALVAVGCFSFPLHLPVTGFAAALAAGRLARSRVPLRVGEPQRGVAHQPHPEGHAGALG